MTNPLKIFFIVGSVIVALLLSVGAHAENGSGASAPEAFRAAAPVVMIAQPWDDPSVRVPAPLRFRNAPSAATASFTINYIAAGAGDGQGATCAAWTASAKAAFEYAAGIWATLISSNVPIKINACWSDFGNPYILGYSWSYLRANFAGAPQTNTWYDYALADALAGKNLDSANPDISITYNSAFAWYFGTNGATPSGTYDFVSVVLHEMGHGLNFSGVMSYDTSGCGAAGYGCWGGGSGYPGIYDRFVENGSGQALLNTALFPNPSAALGAQLKSNNLYFDGPHANAANGGSRIKIYAPATWSQGSSYSHLDYNTFAGTPNRLMVYAISSASSIHDPGPVTLGMLQDMGWNNSVIPPTNTPTVTATPVHTNTPTATGPAGSADLSLSNKGKALSAASHRYTLKLTNAGADAAANIIVTDTLPRKYKVNQVKGGGAQCLVVKRTVTCALAALDPGASVTIKVLASPNGASGQNCAAVIAGSSDPVPGNNQACAAVP